MLQINQMMIGQLVKPGRKGSSAAIAVKVRIGTDKDLLYSIFRFRMILENIKAVSINLTFKLLNNNLVGLLVACLHSFYSLLNH
ncbi:hypothetical protein D3C81_2046190 [compost metagenome]